MSENMLVLTCFFSGALFGAIIASVIWMRVADNRVHREYMAGVERRKRMREWADRADQAAVIARRRLAEAKAEILELYREIEDLRRKAD